MADKWLSLPNSLKIAKSIGIQDFADKLNSVTTVYLYLAVAVIVSTKEYLFSSIECYFPTVPSGKNFEKFLTQYCYVHGTIAILPSEETPGSAAEWSEAEKKYKIAYYQWIPFILGLQCILYLLPKLIWEAFCYNRSGTDLDYLVKASMNAQHTSGKKREGEVEGIARRLEDMFYKHRSYSKGRGAVLKARSYGYIRFVFPSKRLGNWILVGYLFIKVLYCVNAFAQIYIIRGLLGLNDPERAKSVLNGYDFGYRLATNLITGETWDQTRLFPRVTMCHYDQIKHLGASNTFIGQCALPNNMLYEKLYLFLWFWTLLVAAVTVISVPLWFMQLGPQRARNHIVKKYLKIADCYAPDAITKQRLQAFDLTFLRLDGCFLMSMIAKNAGDMIATEIMACLWKKYCEKYEGKIDLRNTVQSAPPGYNMVPPSGVDSPPPPPLPPMNDQKFTI